MDRPRVYHTKQSKPERERQTSYSMPVCGISNTITNQQEVNI